MPSLLTQWYDDKIMKGLFFDWYQKTADAAVAEIAEMEQGEMVAEMGQAEQVGQAKQAIHRTALDIGTGAGYIPIFISRGNPHIQITGIDRSQSMIKRAQDHAASLGAGENAVFEAGDAANLKYPDDTFDMVITTMTIHCLRKPVQMLNEIHRVLKPGGKAWVIDLREYTREDYDMYRKIKAQSPWFMRPFITEKSMNHGSYTPRDIEMFFRQSPFIKWQFSLDGIFFKFSAQKL